MSSIADILTEAEQAIAAITSQNWAGATKAVITDLKDKSPIVDDILDAGAQLIPQLAPVVGLYKLYVALGGEPADVNELVFKRQGDDPYDTGGMGNPGTI